MARSFLRAIAEAINAIVPDAPTAFHDYGVLWLQDRLIYFIDRKPVFDMRVPDTFVDPMYNDRQSGDGHQDASRCRLRRRNFPC